MSFILECVFPVSILKQYKKRIYLNSVELTAIIPYGDETYEMKNRDENFF